VEPAVYPLLKKLL